MKPNIPAAIKNVRLLKLFRRLRFQVTLIILIHGSFSSRDQYASIHNFQIYQRDKHLFAILQFECLRPGARRPLGSVVRPGRNAVIVPIIPAAGGRRIHTI